MGWNQYKQNKKQKKKQEPGPKPVLTCVKCYHKVSSLEMYTVLLVNGKKFVFEESLLPREPLEAQQLVVNFHGRNLSWSKGRSSARRSVFLVLFMMVYLQENMKSVLVVYTLSPLRDTPVWTSFSYHDQEGRREKRWWQNKLLVFSGPREGLRELKGYRMVKQKPREELPALSWEKHSMLQIHLAMVHK